MSKVAQLRSFYDRKVGERDILLQTKKSLKKDINSLTRNKMEWEEAVSILQVVAKVTQDRMSAHIKDIVNSAIQAVFETPYEIDLEFVFRRGRTELDIHYKAFDQKVSKFSGGEMDTVAWSFQIATWSLQRKRVLPIMIQDEPLTYLKGRDLPSRGGEMMRYISEKIGVQVIAVSHIEGQVQHADRVLKFKKPKKYTRLIKGA